MNQAIRAVLGRRRPQGAADSSQSRVTVGELARFGLDRYPAAIGVHWDDDQAVVCRAHVTGAQERELMRRLRLSDDEAKVLVGSPDAAGVLRRECVHCHEGDR